MDMEQIVRICYLREEYDPQCLKFFPNQELILAHNMLIAWWMHLLAGLGHYVVRTGVVKQVMVMETSFMDI